MRTHYMAAGAVLSCAVWLLPITRNNYVATENQAKD